ncbi:MBL fold metallo-hydrolase [Paraliomyxa miuraensis]|uniref:MBL fold metallo-hydrolase n=1 Tax=Paraliomyxa miuraensis TaxID=376150 RepID=UPI002255EB0D|nr:MBL fold metallo-hydrolase [Paraliomyxa miuraensis]MCX4243441.1 MBL fold metallo-hydrolase [Paraliomyxa miuraensis]
MATACRSTPAGTPASAVVDTEQSSSPSPAAEAAPARTKASHGAHRVSTLTITVLSTTRAPVGAGEWGFAALVEADGHEILFDTGAKPRTVLENADALGVALDSIPTVVLSHHHDDHVGGLLTLRKAVAERAPAALATVHVAEGMWAPRHVEIDGRTKEVNAMLTIRPAFEATGGTFVTHAQPAEIQPGVWVTGPVPRVHPERNWNTTRRIETSEGWIEDMLPESQALVIDTDDGLVVLSGCGHAGIVNIVTHARQVIRRAPIRGAVGGFHLHRATAEHVQWTGQRLHEVELQDFYGAHCTGAKAVQHFGTPGVLSPTGRAVELGVGERFELAGHQ